MNLKHLSIFLAFGIVCCSVSTAYANNAWLPIAIYNLLDESPELPAKQPNTRHEWDKYSTTFSINDSGERVLTWYPQNNVTQYKVMYKIANGQWQTQTVVDNQFIVAADITGEIEFRVVGCTEAQLCQDYANEVSVNVSDSNTNTPAYVTIPQVIASGQAFPISWANVANAAMYHIQRSTSLNGRYEILYSGNWAYGNEAHSFDHPSLPNGKYCFKVNGVDAQGSMLPSSQAICTFVGERPLIAPSGLTQQVRDMGVYELSWQDVPGAVEYEIERETYQPPLARTYENLQLRLQTMLVNWSAKNPQARNSNTQWKKVARVQSNSLEQIHTIDTFDLHGQQNYRVKACDSKNHCSQTRPLNYRVPTAHVVNGQPLNLQATRGSGHQINVTWDRVDKADYYTVMMSRKGSRWEARHANINDNAFTITPRLSGEYHFKVEACINAENTDFCAPSVSTQQSVAINIGNTAGRMPRFFAVTPEVGTQDNPSFDIVLSWKQPSLANHYPVKRYEIQGELIGEIKVPYTKGEDNYFRLVSDGLKLAPGREYCYKVRAWFEDNKVGPYTNTECTVVKSKRYTEVQDFRIDQIASKDFRISWRAPSNTSNDQPVKYLLEQQTYSTEKVLWQPVYYGPASEVIQQFSDFHKFYYERIPHMAYRVSACDADGVCGDHKRVFYRNFNPAAYLDSPSSAHLTPACIDVRAKGNYTTEIKWCESQALNVASYELYGELLNQVSTHPVTSLTKNLQGLVTTERSGLEPGRDYCYKVRARMTDGSVSNFSAKQCVTVGEKAFEAVPSLTLEAQSTNQVTLNWSKPLTGTPDLYLLEQQVMSSNGTIDWQAVYFGPQTTYVQNLNNFHKHHVNQLSQLAYRVSACNKEAVCGDYTRLLHKDVSHFTYSAEPLDKDKKPACLNVPKRVNTGEFIPVSWCESQALNVKEYELAGELSSIINVLPASNLPKNRQTLVSVNRGPLEKGREYCYKVRAVYNNGEKSRFTDKQCTVVDKVVFEKPAEFYSSPLPNKQDEYALTWSILTGANSYQLEKMVDVGVWQTAECKNMVEKVVNFITYKTCNVTASKDDYVSGWNSVVYRVAACDKANICGNFARARIYDVTDFEFSTTGKTLSWPYFSGATSYTIEGAACTTNCEDYASLNWQVLTTLSGNQQNYTLPAGSAGTYRIKICFSDGSCTTWSYAVEAPDADFIKGFPYPEDIRAPGEILSSTSVKTIPGNANVTNQGAAEYTIPFETLIGKGGQSVELGVQYSSLSSDNTVGHGWSITGNRAISRCTRSLEGEGHFSAVSFTDQDALCLGGQKLRLVGGTNLSAGSEYRLDQSPNVKIVQTGSGSATQFTLHDGTGNISIFGDDANSVVYDVNSGVPFTWLLSSKQNRFDRKIEFSYKRETHHIPLLSSVTYSGNTVSYHYEARNNKYLKYYLGNRQDDNYRLRKVSIENHLQEEVKYYNFAYRRSSFSQRDLLREVKLCSSSTGVCSVDKTFNYSDKDVAGFSEQEAVIDLSDFAQVDSGIDCPTKASNRTDTYCSVYSMQVADMNNDGSKEIIVSSRKGQVGKVLVFESNGVDFTYNATLSELNGTMYRMNGNYQTLKYEFPWGLVDKNGDSQYLIESGRNQYFDWDGDGIDELSPKRSANVRAYESAYTFDVVTNYAEAELRAYSGPESRDIIYDYNQDGLIDRFVPLGFWVDRESGDGDGYSKFRHSVFLLEINTSEKDVYSGDVLEQPVDRPNGTWGPNELFQEEGIFKYLDYNTAMPGDINGDGIMDYAGQWLESEVIHTGKGFEVAEHSYQVASPSGSYLNHRLDSLADINGDGLSDAIYVENGVIYWNRSLTSSFAGPSALGNVASWGGFTENARYQYADLDGDEQPELIYFDASEQKVKVRFDKNTDNVVLDKLTDVRDNLGKHARFNYKRLNDATVYKADSDGAKKVWGAGSKVRDITSSMSVVSSYLESSSMSTSGRLLYETTSYFYEGFKSQAGGRGSLGFRAVSSTQETTGIKTVKEFMQIPPYNGKLVKTTRSIGDTLLSTKAVESWSVLDVNNGQSKYVVPKTVLTSLYTPEVFEEHLKSTSLANEIREDVTTIVTDNGYTQVTGKKVVSKDLLDFSTQSTVTMTSFNDEDIDNWRLNRPTKVVEVHSRSDFDVTKTKTNTKALTYYASTGALKTLETEPDSTDASLYLLKKYTYDDVGNKTQERLCSVEYKQACLDDIAISFDKLNTLSISRTLNYTFDSDSRYLSTVDNGVYTVMSYHDYNALGQPQEIRHNQFQQNRSQGGNIEGKREFKKYDAFGDLYFSAKNDGSKVEITKASCDSVACPANATWMKEFKSNASPEKHIYYGVSGQKVREVEMLLGGQWRAIDREFDERGREIAVTSPYIMGDSRHWTRTRINQLDLKYHVAGVDGLNTAFSYKGGVITQRVTGNYYGMENVSFDRTRQEVRNGRGELLESIDPNLKSTKYTYNSLSLIDSITGVDNKKTILTYDLLGRRTGLADVDKGNVYFDHNALGEEIKQVKENNTSTIIYRNEIGQIVRNDFVKGGTTITREFNYDGTAYIFGESFAGGATSYTYDHLHRLDTTTYMTDVKNWHSRRFYDSVGRLFRHMDIAGDGYGVQYQYKDGHMDRVFEVKTGHAYYRAEVMDAYKNVTKATVARGIDVTKLYDSATGRLRALSAGNLDIQNQQYQYDQFGNLRHRVNMTAGSSPLEEVFKYDTLNRLTDVQFNGHVTQSIRYFDNGNIKTKSDVEGGAEYKYGTQAAHCGVAAGAHAVTEIGTTQYCYDEAGNQLSQFKGSVKHREVAYTAFNKAATIWSTNGVSEFSYNANNKRYKRVDTENGEVTTTYYIDGNEVIYKADGSSEIKRYIDDIAIHTIKSTGKNTLHYIFNDHLGSGSVITDKYGKVLERMSFDAFGKRREASTWAGYNTPFGHLSNLSALRDITQNGFTGHVQVDHADIIHMEGRIYDPSIGRFVQADPIIQDMRDAQSINRYTYVFNNPLSYTDPTGYDCVNENAPKCAEAMKEFNQEASQQQMGNNGNSSSADVDGSNKGAEQLNSSEASGSGFKYTPGKFNEFVDMPAEAKVAAGNLLESAAIEVTGAEDLAEAVQNFSEGKVVAGAVAVAKAACKPCKAGAKAVDAASEVTKSGDDLAKMSGQLRDAAKGKGNYGLGTATRNQADDMGRAWVGDGAKLASDGKTLVSKDGLRQYRPPTAKPNSPHAKTGVQANLERRFKPEGQWQGNGHLDIED
jgi:RHS repeat-associated protein